MVTVAGVGSLVSEASPAACWAEFTCLWYTSQDSARESFDFSNFRVGEVEDPCVKLESRSAPLFEPWFEVRGWRRSFCQSNWVNVASWAKLRSPESSFSYILARLTDDGCAQVRGCVSGEQRSRSACDGPILGRVFFFLSRLETASRCERCRLPLITSVAQLHS